MTSLPPLDSNIPTTKNPFDSVSMEIRVQIVLEFGFGIHTEVQILLLIKNRHLTTYFTSQKQQKI